MKAKEFLLVTLVAMLSQELTSQGVTSLNSGCMDTLPSVMRTNRNCKKMTTTCPQLKDKCDTKIEVAIGKSRLNKSCKRSLRGVANKLVKEFCTKTCMTCVNGNWGPWSSYGECSQKRTRACDNPVPSGGGDFCNGNSEETSICSKVACPDTGCRNEATWCEVAYPDCSKEFVQTRCRKYCKLCDANTEETSSVSTSSVTTSPVPTTSDGYGTTPATVSEGNVLLLIGGSNETTTLASTEVFNVNRTVSCRGPDFPFAIESHASSITPSGIVTCGGLNCDGAYCKTFNTCYRLDIQGSWVAFPSMNLKRCEFGMMKWMNGLLWAVGGAARNGAASTWEASYIIHNSMEYINPIHSKEWSLVSMPFQVTGHCLVELSHERLMVTGGKNRNGVSTSKTWILDTKTKTWTPGPNMKNDRAHHGCFAVNEQGNISKVYVFGGWGSSGIGCYGNLLGSMDSTEVLNVSNLTWSNGPSLPTSMTNSVGVPSVDERHEGFSVGGWNNAGCNDTYLKNVYGLQNSNGNQHWVEVGAMNAARELLTALTAPSSLLEFC